MTDKIELFDRYRNGESLALNELLDGDRDTFYDYIMRMTGQISRSFDTTEEIFRNLIDAPLSIDNFSDYRCDYFKTARKFNGDIWNANTATLKNPIFNDSQDQETLKFATLDQAVNNLENESREIVVLHLMCDFTLDETAQIMGFTNKKTSTVFNKAFKSILTNCQHVSSSPEEDIKSIVKHLPPVASINATIDLGHVVKGMKNQSIGSKIKKAILLLLIATGILVYFYPTEFGILLDQLIGPVEE